MYFKYKTVEEVINHLQDYLNETNKKIEAWEKVEVRKKKNGEDFARISQSFINAEFGKYTPVEDAFHPYLTVSFTHNHRYWTDEIEAFYYVDELPKDKQDRETIYKSSWSRATSPLTVEELCEKIASHIETLKQNAESLKLQIENAPIMFNTYRQAIADAEKALETADKELRKLKPHLGDLYPTSLYYAIVGLNN